MSKYIVYQNPETNNMEILIPCVSVLDEVIKDIPKKDGNTADLGRPVEYKFIDTVPKYTETYDFINNNVTRNRTKLHNLKKNEWRNLRKNKLEKLDIEFMKSIETNDLVKQEEIKLKKQALRDVTDIDVSNLSDDDLENYTPEILK